MLCLTLGDQHGGVRIRKSPPSPGVMTRLRGTRVSEPQLFSESVREIAVEVFDLWSVDEKGIKLLKGKDGDGASGRRGVGASATVVHPEFIIETELCPRSHKYIVESIPDTTGLQTWRHTQTVVLPSLDFRFLTTGKGWCPIWCAH